MTAEADQPAVLVATYSRNLAEALEGQLKELAGAKVAAADVVNLDAHQRRYTTLTPPHDVVLKHTLERVDEHAARRGLPILVMADEVPGEAHHQKDLGFYQRHGTTGDRSRKLSHIVDTIYFAPSSASRLLQAADLVAFLHHRVQVHGWGSDRRAAKANRMLWGHLESKVDHSGLWVP